MIFRSFADPELCLWGYAKLLSRLLSVIGVYGAGQCMQWTSFHPIPISSMYGYVWNIYLHLVDFDVKRLGKYKIYMDAMGFVWY